MELKIRPSTIAMNLLNEPPEWVRRFNENEVVRRCYESKRDLRRLLGSRCPLPENILDYLDWLEAERECRVVRAIGFFPSS